MAVGAEPGLSPDYAAINTPLHFQGLRRFWRTMAPVPVASDTSQPKGSPAC